MTRDVACRVPAALIDRATKLVRRLPGDSWAFLRQATRDELVTVAVDLMVIQLTKTVDLEQAELCRRQAHRCSCGGKIALVDAYTPATGDKVIGLTCEQTGARLGFVDNPAREFAEYEATGVL